MHKFNLAIYVKIDKDPVQIFIPSHLKIKALSQTYCIPSQIHLQPKTKSSNFLDFPFYPSTQESIIYSNICTPAYSTTFFPKKNIFKIFISIIPKKIF